jgi:hypothetical protein
MNTRTFAVAALLLAAVGLGGYFTGGYLNSRRPGCDLCGRVIYPRLASEVTLKNGGRIETCCPRCALHYEMQNPGKTVRTSVVDVETGAIVEARQAFYVEGSEARGCHPDPLADETPRTHGLGMRYELAFDRCLPNLVAFRNEFDAMEYRHRYGGRVLDHRQALESVKHK